MTDTLATGLLPQDYQDLVNTVRDFAQSVVAPVAAEHDANHTFPYEVVAGMAEEIPQVGQEVRRPRVGRDALASDRRGALDLAALEQQEAEVAVGDLGTDFLLQRLGQMVDRALPVTT